MRKFFFCLPALLGLGGCGESLSPEDASQIGTYTLQTVNDMPLPARILEVGEYSFEVLDGAVTLNPDGSYRNSVPYRVTQGGHTSMVPAGVVGSYERSGAEVLLTASNGEAITKGRIEGKRLTLSAEGAVFVFER